MSDMEPQEPSQPRIIDFSRLSLWTPTPGVENKRARLSFGILDINPRISVFTNNPEDKIGKGIISAAMNPETFFIFLQRLETIAKGNPGQKEKIECFQGREKIKSSDLVFGKDDDGIIWVSVIASNRPSIKFTFEMSDWHTLSRPDGTKFTRAECSVLETLAKINILRGIFEHYFAKVISTPRPDYQSAGADKKQSFQKKEKAASTDLGFEDIEF